MFGWEMWYVSREEKDRIDSTYTFQIPVDDFIVVQIAETAGDPDQLRSSERTIGLPMGPTYQLQAIDPWILCYICQHISIRHPLRHHAKFEHRWRHAFNRQDVCMFHSLANYNFLVVFLRPFNL